LKTLIYMIAISALLTGCALAPNTVRTDVSHMSHASQHFGPNRTNFGAQMLNVTAQWKLGHWFAEVGESYNVSSGMGTGTGWTYVCPGGICGPREITTVSAGYIFQVKP
jgi:hypothetical protein